VAQWDQVIITKDTAGIVRAAEAGELAAASAPMGTTVKAVSVAASVSTTVTMAKSAPVAATMAKMVEHTASIVASGAKKSASRSWKLT
jgi:hypothetical protein